MVHTLTSDTCLFMNYEALLNSTILQNIENVYCIGEASRLLVNKKLIKSYKPKLKKKLMYQAHPIQCTTQTITSVPVTIPTTSMLATSYYQQDYNYPLTLSGWQPMNSTLFTIQPVPVIVPSPSPIFATNICSFAGTIIQPVVTPIVSQIVAQDEAKTIPNYEYICVEDLKNQETYCDEGETATQLKQTKELDQEIETINLDAQTQSDPLEMYLTLPKELFPTARMMSIDPNPIIDEFCKMPNLQQHTPWLLDLEFGIPRTFITHLIPSYNVKFNSIHCKNTPDAIHPGFESCDPDFKKVFLFYYDCIVSAWYRGYIIMNCDISVENFQSWLLLPMQVLGMCWP